MNLKVFESFNNGQLRLPGKTISFADIAWSKHPVFEGVELKHIMAIYQLVVDIFKFPRFFFPGLLMALA